MRGTGKGNEASADTLGDDRVPRPVGKTTCALFLKNFILKSMKYVRVVEWYTRWS